MRRYVRWVDYIDQTDTLKLGKIVPIFETDFYPMLDDNGEFGLLSPIQANPDEVPLIDDGYGPIGNNDGYEADDEGVPRSEGTTSSAVSGSSTDVSISSGASFYTANEILNRNFLHRQSALPYRRMSWQ